MKPTIGRIVHYFPTADDSKALMAMGGNYGLDRPIPGVIVAVWSDTCVNLKLLTDGPYDLWKTSVSQRTGEPTEENPQQYTWDWPPRAE